MRIPKPVTFRRDQSGVLKKEITPVFFVSERIESRTLLMCLQGLRVMRVYKKTM